MAMDPNCGGAMAKGRKSKFDELLDSLLEGKRPEEVLGQEGLLGELTKRLVERALEGEITAQLGYQKHEAVRRVHDTLRHSARHPPGDLHHERHRVDSGATAIHISGLFRHSQTKTALPGPGRPPEPHIRPTCHAHLACRHPVP
jgi:hypothetical protein